MNLSEGMGPGEGNPGNGEIPLLISKDSKGSFRCMDHRQTTHHLAFDKPVKLHWYVSCHTQEPQLVTHPTTDPARMCLTSVIRQVVSHTPQMSQDKSS